MKILDSFDVCFLDYKYKLDVKNINKYQVWENAGSLTALSQI